MNIAITADLHLAPRGEHPERYNAWEDILKKAVERGIETVIVAGDLFDKDFSNYSDFEGYLGKKAYAGVQVYVIPGNHDPNIQGKAFASDNLHIVEKPEIIVPGDSNTQFLFVPFAKSRSMGEVIADFDEDLRHGSWILVGHGDYMEGIKEPNPYEEGIYMPLTNRDVKRFDPQLVFLGHIHKPHRKGKIRYPGSPCPVTVNETGRRFFLVYDTVSNSVEQVPVDAELLYFNQSITVLPVDDEEEYVAARIAEMLEQLPVDETEKERARLRIRVRGYSRNKNGLTDIIERSVGEFSLLDEDGIDLSEVHNTDKSPERIELLKHVRNYIEEMDWPEDQPLDPDKEEIMIQAMKTVLEV